MLAKTISVQFFPEGNDTAALLSNLAIFAAGFLVRPFGALVYGRLGDLVGRKNTFLLTLVLMGGSTFLIGLVPYYKAIGIAAPLLVLLLRLIQGLALGGEYGGAATYVAEHSPENKRGYYTSWIQTTATLGLFVALGVIRMVKSNMSDAAFTAEWGGWRYPFWISILLVGVSIFHTGGEQRFNYPQVRFTRNDRNSFKMAEVFNTTFMVESKLRPNSLRQYAEKFKIPNLAFEGGESGRFDGLSISRALQGIKNVLIANEMTEGTLNLLDNLIYINEDKWIRASSSGLFVWSRSSGQFINKGEILGTITDPDNIKVDQVKSKFSGYIIGHNNASVVHIGDALFHLGLV